MAVVKRRGRRNQREPDPAGQKERPEWAALSIFVLIVILAPLAFGAVDRTVQIGLLALFALGLLIKPPAVLHLGTRGNRWMIALVLMLVVKEFAPAALFGSVQWRGALEQSYNVRFPWTHHPEPGRAIDALLAVVVGFLWLLWARTLAAQRSNRALMGWSLFGSAVVVAAVSFATEGIDAKAIYGMRYTPGWMGFGPFPNRNHTACFLAMGAILGCGCVVSAVRRREYGLAGVGGCAFILVFAGLLATHSRGGLLAFGAGLAVFLLLAMLRFWNRRAAGLIAGGAMAVGAIALAFGAQVLSRFTSASGEVSNSMRMQIWSDAFQVWKDAPLFGHGIASFTSVFPIYQTVPLDNQVVLHPESSWLQWLAELGAVPLIICVAGIGIWLVRGLRGAFERRTHFLPFAGAFGALVVLLCHSAIDVPAHRWGTVAFGLGAFALALPVLRDRELVASPRRVAFVPAGIAALWLWPLLADRPAWAPLELNRLLARDAAGRRVSLEELDAALGWFPLSAKLHQAAGTRQLQEFGSLSSRWAEHFLVASRLSPGSWAVPMYQARLCAALAPGHALHYWQMAVERSGRRRGEVFRTAVSESASLRGAADAWGTYAEAHLELLPIYAMLWPEERGKEAFERWWKERSNSPLLGEYELEGFYAIAPRWLTPSAFQEWTQKHPELKRADFRRWAALLQGWGASQSAWDVLKTEISNPPYPVKSSYLPKIQMERTWRLSPDNFINAQGLARAYNQDGNYAAEREIVTKVAGREGAPVWFRQRAAYCYAQAGAYWDAVNVLLSAKR